MNRARSTAYPTIGSSAIEARSNGFTIIEGVNSSCSGHLDEPVQERLSFCQALTASIVMCIIICTLGFTLSASNYASERSYQSMFEGLPHTRVIVHEGDTLWDIAEAHAPEGVDTALVVRWITQENNLTTACIYAGQILTVPSP